MVSGEWCQTVNDERLGQLENVKNAHGPPNLAKKFASRKINEESWMLARSG